jgi:hypothetical protein
MSCKWSAADFRPGASAFVVAVDVDVDCTFDFHVILSELERSLCGLTTRNP